MDVHCQEKTICASQIEYVLLGKACERSFRKLKPSICDPRESVWVCELECKLVSEEWVLGLVRMREKERDGPSKCKRNDQIEMKQGKSGKRQTQNVFGFIEIDCLPKQYQYREYLLTSQEEVSLYG